MSLSARELRIDDLEGILQDIANIMFSNKQNKNFESVLEILSRSEWNAFEVGKSIRENSHPEMILYMWRSPIRYFVMKNYPKECTRIEKGLTMWRAYR